MGSTQIINQTSKPLDMKVGSYRYFTKLATVGTNKSYTVHVNYDHTYIEYSLGADDDGAAGTVIVNSDDCVDNKTIIVREVDGQYEVEMEPRSGPRSSTSSSDTASAEPSTKNLRWKFWQQ